MNLVVKDEQYEHMVQELVATVSAYRQLEGMNRVRMYFNIGHTIKEYETRREIVGVTEFIKQVHKDTGLHDRNLWWAKELVTACPTWEQVEALMLEHRNWTGMKLYLGEKTVQHTVENEIEKFAHGIIKRHGIEKAKEIANFILSQ